MLWACVYLPYLALDGALRHRSGNKPLALVGGGVLLDVNDTARAAGLRPGQTLNAAHALLADFEVVEHDPAADRRRLKFLAAWAYRYSGDVALLDDSVVLEVGRSLALFGPWRRLQARIRQDLNALGFRHAIALAPTARAAHVLAGWQDGLEVDDPAVLRSALAVVPVERTHLPGNAGERLAGMGLRTLGQVISLPRAALVRRFGKALTVWLDTLLGDQPDPLTPYRPPDRFDQRLEFDHGIESQEALGFPLRRLVGDLSVFLSGRDGGVQRFEIGLEHEHCTATTVAIGLRSAERDAGILFELAREYMARQQLPEAACAMRLCARELPQFVPACRDLFDSKPAEAVSLEHLLERLRARLGEGSVYRLHATVDPRPERAQRREPAHGRAGSVPPACARAAHGPARPTWLLQRPIRLRGPSPHVLAGPERLETGWWDGGDIRRDYYVVETSQGQRAWVFCAPGEPGCWMLHGWFA